MKTYNETVMHLANQLYNAYLGGSPDTRCTATSAVGFIFGVGPSDVAMDVKIEFNKLKSEKN